MSNSIDTQESRDYSQFIPDIVDGLQRVSDTYLDNYDEHHAFVYWVAELLETTDPDKFFFTDGPKDGGIDFAITDSHSYTICQCKCPDIEKIRSQKTPFKFPQNPVEELLSAITLMRDSKGEYDINPELKRIRGDYQRDLSIDPENTNLTAIVAVMGELSDQAITTYKSFRISLAQQGITLKLVDWETLYNAVHQLRLPSDIDFEIHLSIDDANSILSRNNYCYLLAHAFDFYDAFRKHEWNLFEWNVRYQLYRSPINKRIVGTLLKSKGRKLFHHYNNGLLITCKSYKKDNNKKRITLVGPQIINGCQTVRAICDAYESLPTPSDQEHFRENTLVQVKIIQATDPELISELVISTNDQNPMKPRNLKSNNSEQQSIQKSFRDLPNKWFYQRKDGEFESLCSSDKHIRWFRKSDYSSGKRKYRVIDNEVLAKDWYAFTGNSNIALRGGVNYFLEEPDGVYNRVFKKVPNPTFWSKFRNPNYLPDAEQACFEPGIPSAYQYLLATSIGNYINTRRISYAPNKEEALSRGIELGRLTGDLTQLRSKNSEKEIDEFLATDLIYNINIMINNMRDVFIELFSFIIVNKYGPCDAITAQKILTKFSPENEIVTQVSGDADQTNRFSYESSLFSPIYEFICDCIKQYYLEFKAEIKATPRLKSYLAQRSTVNKLRETIITRNTDVIGYDKPWKITEKSFFDSMPKID